MPNSDHSIPENLYYDQNDLWIKIEGSLAVIGMSEDGQKNTGDVLYLELAAPGTVLRRGEKFGSIESGKWVGNLNAPLSGVVEETNRAVERSPRQVNRDAYGQGWMIRLVLSHPEELQSLMTSTEYADWLAGQAACAWS